MVKQTRTLVGTKRFMSKKGKEYAVLQTTVPFSNREIETGSLGIKVEEIFVPDNLLSKVSELTLNKPIGIDYDVVNNKAYVCDFWTVDK